LKGFKSRIDLFAVRGEREVESRFDAAHASTLAKFVGRTSEIGMLLERWELVKGGQGKAVFVSGEAGIGKSRLVDALEERLHEKQHELIRLQCSPYHATSIKIFLKRDRKPPSRSHKSTYAATIVFHRVSFDFEVVGFC
jgi:DNA-binding NtrC family response regulator